MSLSVVGVSHRTAPIEVRERFHVSERELETVLGRLHGAPAVTECVVLSTCNRSEFYLAHGNRRVARGAVIDFLAERAGLDRRVVSGHLYHMADGEAVMHLFRVTSGLDSLVVGEPQIQGQVGEAYDRARESFSRVVGPVLHRLFQSALEVGGRVRAETKVSEGVATVPSAAVQLTEKVFGRLEGRRTMVLGAGDMGELTVRALQDRGVEVPLVVSRTLEHALRMAERHGAKAVPYEEFWSGLVEVDMLVASSSAPHPLITRERLQAVRGDAERPLVIMDIAVPRDVDSDVAELPGVFLYNIDDLQQVVEATERARGHAVPEAERLVEEQAERFLRWYRAREAVPLIRGMRARAEELRREQIESALAEMDGLSPEETERLRAASRLMLNKLLHGPTVALRRVANEAEGERMLELARRLFGLEEERGDG